MFVIESGRARRTRKCAILMVFILLMFGSPAALMAIFTLHWDVGPKE